MRRALVLSAAISLAQVSGQAGIKVGGEKSAAGRVSLSQDPHFRMLMENAMVRVWLLELQPDEKTGLVYQAHNFLQVPLREAWLSTSIEGRQPIPFWAEKKARFVGGGFSQVLQNSSKSPVRIVEIELMKEIGVERCGPEAEVSCGCLGASAGVGRILRCGVLETDAVAINQLESHANDKQALSTIPTLVVAIDSVKIAPMDSYGEEGLNLEPGEIVWVDKAVQGVQGLDRQSTAKSVTIEFKKPRLGLAPDR